MNQTLSAHKAVYGALATALVAGLLVLYTALDDNVITAQEWVAIVLALLGGPGAVGGTVYQTRNRPRPRRRAGH